MTEIKTGIDVIRGALLNRAKHGHLGLTARDLGVSVGALCGRSTEVKPSRSACCRRRSILSRH
jgi:hypothetical protein